jgi:hypothetical protein
MAELDIILKRPDGTYAIGERVRGVVKVTTKSAMKHNGIRLLVEGDITFKYTDSNNVNLFDVVMNSFKPIKLLDFVIELEPAGKLPEGPTEIPFEFVLQRTITENGVQSSETSTTITTTTTGDNEEDQANKKSHKLYATYHGQYLSVKYRINAEMKMGFFSRDAKKTTEFIVYNPGQGFQMKHVELEQAISLLDKGKSDANTTNVLQQFRKDFDMQPSKLQNVRKSLIGIVPDYHIVGHLTTVDCNIGRPFTGELRVLRTAVNIKSIELQLVRVESCAVADGTMIREPTEIQNLQLADGNVSTDFTIPIFMIFPRLFTCPTLITPDCRVEFEVNLIILFTDGHQITENVPLRLYCNKVDSAANRLEVF